MKKVILFLCAALLALSGCEPQSIHYVYKDLGFYYSPEFSIFEETGTADGLRLRMGLDEDNEMRMTIREMDISGMTWEDRQACVRELGESLYEDFRGDDSYVLDSEPYFWACGKDRFSDPDPEVNYRYEGTHSGKPCLGSITVKMVGPYLVTMLYEAATRDNKDLLVDIDYSLKLLD